MTICANNLLLITNKVLQNYIDSIVQQQKPHAETITNHSDIHASTITNQTSEETINHKKTFTTDTLFKNLNNRFFSVAHASAEECDTECYGIDNNYSRPQRPKRPPCIIL